MSHFVLLQLQFFGTMHINVSCVMGPGEIQRRKLAHARRGDISHGFQIISRSAKEETLILPL